MSTSTPAAADPDRLDDVDDGPTYRLSADQYRRMRELGILAPDEAVELVDGRILRRGAGPGDPGGMFYRFSVEQYHRMAEAALLTDDENVELLEGWLVARMTKYPPHELAKGLATDALTALLPPGWFVKVESPAETPDSEPEPDLSVVRGSRRDYMVRHPVANEVALVVEVADSSRRRDQIFKKRLYARAGLSVYWIINLVDHCIEVYSDPTGSVDKPDYRARRDYGPAEDVPVVLDGREVGRVLASNLLP